MLTHLLIGDQPVGSSLSRSSRLRRLRPHSSPGLDRVHVAAVCYRMRDDEPEFLLVRTRNGHWTFPKGGVDEDPTHAEAAAREAYEEAGVKGHVERSPFISYWHCKPGRLRRRVVLVHAHLCEVKRLVRPAESYRDPKWFNAEKAKRQLQKYRTLEFAAELADVIDQATKRLQKIEAK